MGEIGIIIGPKGRGSNMLAIAEACAGGNLSARVRVVVAPKPGLPATEKAEALGLTCTVTEYEPEASYPDRLVEALQGCDLVCLAGYLRVLPKDVLAAFPDRVLNIHPSLLPDFGGKGMYGMNVHNAVVSAHRTESGCTVHLVGERYDDGRILVQRQVPVRFSDDAETLAARVLEQEHIAYPEAIRLRLRELGL